MFENLDSMFENIEELQPSKKFGKTDERFWKISRNDDDMGIARVRLLPGKVIIDDKEKIIPYVRFYKYAINLKPFGGKKFADIDIAEKNIFDNAVNDLRKELFNQKDDTAKKLLEEVLKRRERYVSNMYVINDPIKTENSNKLFLYEFGSKLKEKFEGWRNPPKEDIAMGAKPVNVWHPLQGADIKLVMKKGGAFYNYDDTSLLELKSFEKWTEVKDSIYDLTEFLDGRNFMKYYEQVEKLRWLFDGTPVESYLKSIGSFIYDGVYDENKVTKKVSNKSVEENQSSDQLANQSPQEQLKAEEDIPSADDDLDFLDDI